MAKKKKQEEPLFIPEAEITYQPITDTIEKTRQIGTQMKFAIGPERATSSSSR